MVNPRSATSALVLAALLCSANASSGSAWMSCDSAIRSLRRLSTRSWAKSAGDATSGWRRGGELAGTIEVSHRGLSSRTVGDEPLARRADNTDEPLARRANNTGIAEQAAAAIAEHTGVGKHDVAVVIGSGWAPAAEALGPPNATVDMDDLPGFTPPAAVGHRGKVMSVAVDD